MFLNIKLIFFFFFFSVWLFRAVAEEQRSLALAVQSVLWRAIGSIPGPLLFGVIFDTSCVYWQEECGRRGNCWVYNNNSIGTRAFSLSIAGVCINTVFMVLCWILYPPVHCTKPKSSDKEDGPFLNKQVTNPVFSLDYNENDTPTVPDPEI